MSNAELIAPITELLYREADFLDAADLDGWIELYTQDGTYWMPVTPEQEDPINHISLFYDDRTIMEVRRRNLNHPRASSKDLPIRCSHIIGNIRMQDEQVDGIVTVTSNFQCVIYSNEKQQLFAGKYTHQLVQDKGQWLIKTKRVDLINCDAALGSILIYI